MAGHGKGRRATVGDDWSDLVEAPRANMPDPAKVVRKRRWLTALVWAVLGAFLLSTLALLAMVANLNTSQATAATDTFSLAKVAGTKAMQEWLTQTPPPLMNGRILTVDGVEPVKLAAADTKQVKFEVDLVNFTLVDGFNQMFRSSVQVAVDPRGSAEAISTPSLEPIPGTADDSWQAGTTWPGMKTGNVPDPVRKAIAGWAAAYTSGDPDTLRLAVGDPDATHWYEPLVGVQKVTADPAASTPLDDDQTVLAVQVKLQLLWVGQTVESGTQLPPVTMDVLVERADTAAPVVTAWGPSGVGPNLERYGNAVDGTGRSQPSAEPIPTPTVSETPVVPPDSGTPSAPDSSPATEPASPSASETP